METENELNPLSEGAKIALIFAGIVVVGGLAAVILSGSSASASSPPAPPPPPNGALVPPATGPATTPTVTLGHGIMGQLIMPSFSGSGGTETIAIQGQAQGATQGVISGMSSSNPAVLASLTPSQAQDLSTLWTMPILGPGTTTVNFTWIDSSNQTNDGSFTLTVLP
jgi:hypothetical protein